MAWVKIGDEFTDRPMWEGVSYEARWHYMAMVCVCSRTKRWDGRLPFAVARRASDVPDADRCHDELRFVGAVTIDEEAVTIVDIDEHLPPPSVRRNAELSKERMRRLRERKRLHGLDDHTLCEATCA